MKFMQTKIENNQKRKSECGIILPSGIENVSGSS